MAGAVGVAYALWLQARGEWGVGLPWERSLLLSLDREAPRVVDWVMLALPWLGTNLTLMPILAVVSLWLWRRKGRGDLAAQIMVTVLGSLILNAALKDLFDRPRPDLWAPRGQYQWAAYPSGHAIVGVAVFFMVARLLFREKGWRWPFAVAAGMLAVNLYSRLYLGVHWPTDIIGGLLLGIVWLAAVVYAFRSVEQLRAPALEESPTVSFRAEARRAGVEESPSSR